jgi:hypothetical protein
MTRLIILSKKRAFLCGPSIESGPYCSGHTSANLWINAPELAGEKA